MIDREIDSLVVIGGDGSLTGADLFRQEWPSLLQELVELGQISAETAERHANLAIVGLVGSIDNDMHGTNMTIGADTALHRITEAIDAIASTAASHQRTFVVKVMGRNCGYLALMAALATGAEWVLIPENPPPWDNWEEKMVGRPAARARSRAGVTASWSWPKARAINTAKRSAVRYVQKFLEDELGEEVRTTVLGHVQRGGSPSAFDRNLGTMMGYQAVDTVLAAQPEDEPQMIAIRGNRITTAPLMQCVEQTRAVAKAIDDHDYERAMELRGEQLQGNSPHAAHLVTLTAASARAGPEAAAPGRHELRRARARHEYRRARGGAPGPGSRPRHAGHRQRLQGLHRRQVQEMDWMSVSGWASMGGSGLGTSREVPSGRDFYAIARTIEKYDIQRPLDDRRLQRLSRLPPSVPRARKLSRPSTSRSCVCPRRSTTTCPAPI